MQVTSSLRRRVEASPVTVALAVGDLVAIGGFVVAGVISHGYHPVADAGRVAGTFLPFLVGWLVVAVAGRLYTREAVSTTRRAVFWTVPAWGGAVLIAQALRATAVFHGNAAVTFALVAFGVGAALLAGWRVFTALLLARSFGDAATESSRPS